MADEDQHPAIRVGQELDLGDGRHVASRSAGSVLPIIAQCESAIRQDIAWCAARPATGNA
jgi:hypothetical protein